MKSLNNYELEQTQGGGWPLLVALLIGGVGAVGFINGCTDSQEDDCYYTDTEGNECPCGS